MENLDIKNKEAAFNIYADLCEGSKLYLKVCKRISIKIWLPVLPRELHQY
jgi:hypothetical protein